jgi:hypothetical protein
MHPLLRSLAITKIMNRYQLISASLFLSSLSVALAPGIGLAQTDFNSFFQEGRTRAENTLILTPQPDPSLPITPNSEFWQFLVFRSAGASLWMPPGTLSEESIVLNTPLGKINFRAIAANTKDSRYLAAYAPSLTPEQLANPDKLFKAIADRVSLGGQFKVIRNTPITFQSRSGREVTLQDSDETIVFRVFLSNQKIYALGVRYSGLAAPSRQVTGYLRSFSFL